MYNTIKLIIRFFRYSVRRIIEDFSRYKNAGSIALWCVCARHVYNFKHVTIEHLQTNLTRFPRPRGLRCAIFYFNLSGYDAGKSMRVQRLNCQVTELFFSSVYNYFYSYFRLRRAGTRVCKGAQRCCKILLSLYLETRTKRTK